ncbi:hypothetical protein [Actinoallomurus sp. NPDC050550]
MAATVDVVNPIDPCAFNPGYGELRVRDGHTLTERVRRTPL